jgi:hypothetical protein
MDVLRNDGRNNPRDYRTANDGTETWAQYIRKEMRVHPLKLLAQFSCGQSGLP